MLVYERFKNLAVFTKNFEPFGWLHKIVYSLATVFNIYSICYSANTTNSVSANNCNFTVWKTQGPSYGYRSRRLLKQSSDIHLNIYLFGLLLPWERLAPHPCELSIYKTSQGCFCVDSSDMSSHSPSQIFQISTPQFQFCVAFVALLQSLEALRFGERKNLADNKTRLHIIYLRGLN